MRTFIFTSAALAVATALQGQMLTQQPAPMNSLQQPPQVLVPMQQNQTPGMAVQPGQPVDAAAASAQAKLDQDLTDTANVANQWLKLIDDARYGESWDYGSQKFQFTIKRDEWIKAEEKLRRPFGRLISRQLIEQRTAKDPKGLPPGDYMVLYYRSSFTGRPEAQELITMVKESDGGWRVLTYNAA